MEDHSEKGGGFKKDGRKEGKRGNKSNLIGVFKIEGEIRGEELLGQGGELQDVVVISMCGHIDPRVDL